MYNTSKRGDCFSNMALTELREKTYLDWPFKNGKCTAKEMAKAGFYATKRDEAVMCYFCFKELEGWEQNDDPFQEHKRHASYCEFVNMFDKAPESITFSQLLQLERGRMKRLWELEIKRKEENIQQVADDIVNSSNNNNNKKKKVKSRK